MCKLTNTWLPPSGKLWLSGCMRVCICGGTCMYDYRSGNNSPTGVNEASDWRSSLPVSTELWKTVWLWELTRLREPRWGERAGREPVLMGNVKRCSGGRVWLAPRRHCTLAMTPASRTSSSTDTLNNKNPPPDVFIQFRNSQRKLQINQGRAQSIYCIS